MQTEQISTEIKVLKKLILTSKKESKELSQAYAAIVKQIENLTIGVKNPETDENKLIIKACEKELKEQEQSKSSGAPYSETTMKLCRIFLENLKPKLVSPNETEEDIAFIIKAIKVSGQEPTMQLIMKLIKEGAKPYDMKLVSSLVQTALKSIGK
jgi:septal ring factor EnvC (AmiA/AmiB activator)